MIEAEFFDINYYCVKCTSINRALCSREHDRPMPSKLLAHNQL